jgi:bacterioferritin-associated ferredoxin
MIVCSCSCVSDHDIELALLDILNEPEAPLPTPGVVYRHMQKRMQCCGCAPLAVEVIYAKLEDLERKGLICPYRSLSSRERLLRLQHQQHQQRRARPAVEPAESESCRD